MKNNNPSQPSFPTKGRSIAFTMVELLVATTILIILAGISFITYTGYLNSVRDGNRIAVLGNIRLGLDNARINNELPLPDGSVTVSYSGSMVGKQGYAGESVLGYIGLSEGGKDPEDEIYYTYYLSHNKKYYQLLGYLETDEYLNAMTTPSSFRMLGRGIAHAGDIDYSERYVYVTGDPLGVLTQSGTQIPIQELPAIIASGGLDISMANDDFIGHIDPERSISGDLSPLAYLENQGGRIAENCEDLLQLNPSLSGIIGDFTVFPSATGATVVTCDFSSDSLDTVSNSTFEITNSLRFNSDDNAYLSWIPSQAGDRRKWTWSGWVKRSGLERTQTLFSATSGGNSNKTFFSFMSDDTLRFASDHDGGAHEIDIQTTAKFRDVSSWYHIQISVDTTTSSVSIFVNGEEITGLLLSTYPSLNYETWINSQQNHYVGAFEETLGHNIENFLDGYMTEVYFIDGQALTPDSFGESESNGKWIPKEYTGTYGTNGFHLQFSDSSILGKDTSGNAHHFSANNLDSTDQVIDTPNNNFSVMNSILNHSSDTGTPTFTEGNLLSSMNLTTPQTLSWNQATIEPLGGKYYFEVLINSTIPLHSGGYPRVYAPVLVAQGDNTHNSGDTLMVAIDIDTGKVWSGKNGTWLHSGNPSSGINSYGDFSIHSNPTISIMHSSIVNTTSSSTINFGQGGQSGLTYYENAGGYFKYEPPTGFTALSSKNLPDAFPVYDSQTNLLIRSNTVDGSTDIQDISGSAHTIQVYGDTHHTTDERKIGTTSISFDGNGDYLEIPDSADWDFGDEDFTIDFWVYPNTLGDAGLIGQMYDSPNSNFRTTISMDATDIFFTSKNGGSNILAEYSAAHNFSIDQWYHVAAVRSGTGFSMYVNGSALSLSTITPIDSNVLPDLNSDIFIGKKYGGGTDYFDGYMDEIRISKGIARWSADFIPQVFAYDLVTGYNPIIENANQYFDVLTYTGNGSSQNITGLNFQPDFVWLKTRSSGIYDHHLYDSIRGANQWLGSNVTDVEIDLSWQPNKGLESFNTSGFSIGSHQGINAPGEDYVAWNWKESQASGFDIVAYTGAGVNGTMIPHNLGVKPDIIIIKGRDNAYLWPVYSSVLGADNRLALSDTLASISSSLWDNGIEPDSRSFYLSYEPHVNEINQKFVAYLFAEKPGFSKFGSYTGDGDVDGPFVYTGFKPRYVMIKRTDSTSDWTIQDTARMPINPTATSAGDLWANVNDQESGLSAYYVDYLSNGFKIRNTYNNYNTNGGNYIYMAFAEYPFK